MTDIGRTCADRGRCRALCGQLACRRWAGDADRLTTADAWLTPLRYSLDGLMNFSGRTNILDRHNAVRAYADVARRDPHLGRVWREMDDGLKAFMASRAG